MQGLLFYTLTVLIWGSTWFAIRFQLDVVDPTVSLFYRFGLASVLLLAWCVLKQYPMRYSLREHVAMAAQGVCLFCINYLLFYWCTGYITSGLVAVIFSTVIVMNIINNAIFLRRPVRPLVLVGALVGLTGIVLVFWQEIVRVQALADDSLSHVGTGLLLGLAATFCASLGNILSSRNQSYGLPILQTNAFGMGYGALLMLVAALISGKAFVGDFDTGYVVSLLYLSLFGSIIAFGAYLSLVGTLGADKAAYATVLFPIVALLISSVFEDFEWSARSATGVLLVLMGNVLVVGRQTLSRVLNRRRSANQY